MPPANNNEIPEMKTIETTDKTSPSIDDVTEEEMPTIEMSETPIDDLKKLTEYEDDKIDSTNINSLFDKLSVNVKDASEIFRKNTSLKEKIDTRFEELKSLQSELENSRRKQIDEIDKYRDEVLNKLSEKKSEIEKRLNILKDLQATLEKEKTEFEDYKRKEQSKISKIQKEVQSAYDERREELEHIEDVLRKQKDSLDEERNQLSLDKIQYEADKNDLANNLLKFNQIVNSFTNGIEMKTEE
jgi:chromosome segregation ATPase